MPANDTNYSALWAITDNVNNKAADPIKNNGVFQGAVVNLLNTIRTNLNGVLTKLDADSGVTDTNYSSLWAIPSLNANQISQNGIGQDALYTRMALIVTNWIAVLTKMDSDAGILKTDYLSNGTLSLNATVKGTGISQKDLVSFLDTFITKFNTVLINLDQDSA